MNWPSAVKGHMPFVDNYKQKQIQKVIEKHRARHHSGPESKSPSDRASKQKNTHSMPILWQSVYTGQKPKFISMPALDDSRIGLHSRTLHTTHHKSDSSKNGKNSLLSSLKKIFTGKKEGDNTGSSSKSLKHGSSGAIVQGNQSRPYNVPSASKKPADGDIVISGGRSPKRQRMRTISNISGIMETIEEVNEVILASTECLSEASSSSSSVSTGTRRSIESVPELSSTNLFYSCGNLSNFSDSSSSHHGSSDLICV